METKGSTSKLSYLDDLSRIAKKLRTLLRDREEKHRSISWNRKLAKSVLDLETWMMNYGGYRLVEDNIILIGGMAKIYTSSTPNPDKLRSIARTTLRAVESGKGLEDRGWGPFPDPPKKKRRSRR